MYKRFCIISLLMALCGCRQASLPALPDDSIAFTMGTFEDTEHDSAMFGTLEYNERTYIGYGTINNSYRQEYIDQCIGYIVMDENSTSVPDPDDRNTRVYTLVGDTENNFLMEYDDTVKLMNQPYFWRALDTKGKDIEIPRYIDELEYDYWK